MRTLLTAVLLLTFSAGAEYNSLRWGASLKDIQQKHPAICLQNECFFDWVNVFGADSVEVYSDSLGGDLRGIRQFSLFRKGLVAVDLRYTVDSLLCSVQEFENRVIAPLIKKYGSRKYFRTDHDTKTALNRYYVFRTKTEIVVAMYGHFKDLPTGFNQDWARVTYYQKDFYEFKNKDRQALYEDNEWPVFY